MTRYPGASVPRGWRPPPPQMMYGPNGQAVMVSNGGDPGKPARGIHIILILLLCIICFPLGLVVFIVYICTRRRGTPIQNVAVMVTAPPAQ